MKKKILVIFMTVCLTVSLAACGNSEKRDKKEANNETGISDEVNTKMEEKGDVQEQSKSDEQQTANQDLKVDEEYANLPESQGFMFESKGDGTCALTKIGDCTDSDIIIPEKSPEGDRVTMIAEQAFYGAEDINSIVFAGKTMELDKKAFQSCGVKKIVISGCDLVIGENAFSYCEDISEVYISNSIIELDSYAFYDTGKDISVKIVNSNGVLDEKAFQACAISSLMINDSTLELGKYVFAYCEDLTEVTVGGSTVEIGSYAFYQSGDDATVTFSNCGLDIDEKAFQSSGLTALNISEGEMVMGDYAFAYCEDLKDLIIGVGNMKIGKYSFYECTSLENVSLAAESEDDSHEIVIEDRAFQSCSVQKVIIGKGNVELGDNAFSFCEDLMSVEIKGKISDIGDNAFYECPAKLVISYNGGSYNKESIEEIK